MRRDARAYLWDVQDAADAIISFTLGRNLDDYLNDRMLRSAVERQFEIIGEALNQLRRADATLAARIPELSRIVGFRNVLIHGYDEIDSTGVWRVVETDLVPLHERVAGLLQELDRKAESD